MDNVKKRQIKKYVSWISMVLVVALLAAMSLLSRSEAVADGPQASILSGTVEKGSITSALHGGGTLSSPDKTEINLPTGVKLKEFLVSNGQFVEEGTPLALIDRISVMSTITAVQETMDHLLEQMQEAEDADAPDEILALAGGRVKQIFAHEGEAVSDVMLRDGALAVLSLDGLMAVRLEVASPLTAGSAVEVRLSDDSIVTGRVKSNLDGILTVTVEDEGYPVGETVTVLVDDSPIGQGVLYIHNAWKAVAYSGIIDRVRIDSEEMTDAEDVLFDLTHSSSDAQRIALARKHQEYQELMLRLFRMYQSETIDAPCSGLISGIEEDSIHLLSGNGSGLKLDLLINAPNGDDGTFYLNFAGIVTGVASGNWNLSMDLTPLTITDYRDLSGLALDPAAMTQPVSFVPTMPVYQLAEGNWVQIDPAYVMPGDFLLVAMDTSGNFVWVVRITEENRNPQPPVETEPTLPPMEPTIPVDPTIPVPPPAVGPTEPTVPADPTVPSDPTIPSEPSEPTVPTDPTIPTFPSIPDDQYPNFQIPDDFWAGMGGFGGYGGYGDYGSLTPEEPEFELYDLESETLMTVTGQDTMCLTITIDEQDISSVSVGQPAQIRVEAFRDMVFPAQVTSIGRSGSNNGGSSKFTVELTLEKQESMLPGMSAIVSIPLSVLDQVPLVPLAALVEQGAKTILYTGYDETNDILINPVEVIVGMSDETHAQIMEGLEPGDLFYYAYYDVLELSTDVDTNRSPFG